MRISKINVHSGMLSAPIIVIRKKTPIFFKTIFVNCTLLLIFKFICTRFSIIILLISYCSIPDKQEICHFYQASFCKLQTMTNLYLRQCSLKFIESITSILNDNLFYVFDPGIFPRAPILSFTLILFVCHLQYLLKWSYSKTKS